MVKVSTAAGITTASPLVHVNGAEPRLSTIAQPWYAVKHHTLPWLCRGRRNSHGFSSANLSTTKQGDVIRFAWVLPFSDFGLPGFTFPAWVCSLSAASP